MKATALAILLVSHLAEVGLRTLPKALEAFNADPGAGQVYNQTCVCHCICDSFKYHFPSAILGLLFGLLAGSLIGVVSCQSSEVVHGYEPRRRGGGIVIMPPRANCSCLVL